MKNKKTMTKSTILFILISLLFGQTAAQDTIRSEQELLYNGIKLPAQWPPRTGNPKSADPMKVPYLINPPSIIPIDIGRQLFVDDFLIAKTTLKRTYHTARKLDQNPVFYAETKYEHNPAGTPEPGQRDVTYLGHGGLFYDFDEQLFKMFYTAGWRGGLALATSKDLINWNRPDLCLVDQNIILPPGWLNAGGDNAVWLDSQTENADEKFKFLTDRGTHKKENRMSHTLHISKNGRIWSQGLSTSRADDYCSFFYNPFRDKWVFSIKKEGLGRARWYAESDDFLAGRNWDDAVFWVNADALDKPDPEVGDPAQLYSLNAVAYESIILGEFYIHLGPNNSIAHKGKFPKITELKLGFSRDGFHWSRPDRRPFINATRQEGDWDRAYLHGTMGVCLVMGDELWFPYCGYSGTTEDGYQGMYTAASIGFATLRRDGFASMGAGNKAGELTTNPVTFSGKYLFVNVDCPEGELLVEILDEHGKVIEPFNFKNCIPTRDDETLHQIEWKGKVDLSPLAGTPVRFRFRLTNGELYAFWVSSNLNGASNGYLAAGGPGYDGIIDTKGKDAN